MSAIVIILAVVAAYLVGSVSGSRVLASLFAAPDIRRTGSGNAGATNAWRVRGAGYGLAVLAFDLVKGAVATGFVAVWLAPNPAGALVWPLVCGFAAVLGHVWPVFHDFRGGKGVATGAGVLALALPAVLLAGVAVAALVFVVRRIASLATLAGALASAVAVFCLPGMPPSARGFVLALLLLLVYTHRDNIARLRAGTEPPVGRSSP